MKGGERMAKHKKKDTGIEADQFEVNKPNQWPDGCQQNSKSATGYSYGTLILNSDGTDRDGFEIVDMDYICTNSNGIVYRMSESEFNDMYVIV